MKSNIQTLKRNHLFNRLKSNTKIIIQARLRSKRFPQKILKKISKKNVIEFLIENLLTKFSPSSIILATTKNKIERNNKFKRAVTMDTFVSNNKDNYDNKNEIENVKKLFDDSFKKNEDY